jgi:salicylate 5-hydroxylase small subunit
MHRRWTATTSAHGPIFLPTTAFTKLQSRENFDRQLPLCILSFESKAMMVDRVYGVVNTIYHDHYWQRHVCGVPLITRIKGEQIECESSVVVIRTPRDAMPQILCAGRYIDRLTRENGEKRGKGRP